ncbi:HEAT repeat domain-containing protein [Gemmatimonadota bacterium]
MTENPQDPQESPSGAGLDWDDSSDLPVQEVKELFVVLGKALRAQQLYDENNPVYQRFISQFQGALKTLWERVDRIQVQVEENRLIWLGEEVYRSENRTDSLAFLLFKDGIREVTFLEGLEGEELVTLLQILNRARDLRPEGDDLLTVLWEHDLEFFTYHYVDLLAEGVDLPTAGEGHQGGFQEVLRQEMEEAGGEALAEEGGPEGEDDRGVPPPSQVSAEDFNPTLYSLDPGEMDQIRTEVQAEMDRNLRRDVLAALFDRVEEPTFPLRQRRILEVFRTLLPNLLSRGGLRAAGAVLEEVTRLLQKEGALSGEHTALAEEILDELSEGATVRELVQALEDGTLPMDAEGLRTFLRYVRAGALVPLLKAVEATESRSVKGVVEEALKGLAGKYSEALLDAMESEDPVVAAGACRLAGRIQLEEAGAHVASLMAHGSPDVRMAAVEAAADLRASTAAGALQETLYDTEREVRIAAARALGLLRFSPAAPFFREIIQSRGIRQADISEQIAIFENYGRLRDPEGVPVLDALLNSRGFLGKKETGEIRACAALALGKMGTPEARKALERAAEEQDPVVRSAVNRALREEG